MSSLTTKVSALLSQATKLELQQIALAVRDRRVQLVVAHGAQFAVGDTVGDFGAGKDVTSTIKRLCRRRSGWDRWTELDLTNGWSVDAEHCTLVAKAPAKKARKKNV